MIGEQIIKDVFKHEGTVEQCKENVFKDEYGELIVLQQHTGNFDAHALAGYVCQVENICQEYGGKVNLYILMDPHGEVSVTERDIKSQMDFTIKLACNFGIKDNLDFIILNEIKKKIADNSYTEEDISMLQLLPLYCNSENRLEIRKEVFDILESLPRIEVID